MVVMSICRGWACLGTSSAPRAADEAGAPWLTFQVVVDAVGRLASSTADASGAGGVVVDSAVVEMVDAEADDVVVKVVDEVTDAAIRVTAAVTGTIARPSRL